MDLWKSLPTITKGRLARIYAILLPFRLLTIAQTLFEPDCATILSRPLFGYRIYLAVGRSNAQRLIYLLGERYIVERTIIRKLVTRGATSIDVGANIGYYALMLARFGSTRILCIEPEPENVIELRRNVNANSIPAVILEIAVGSADGEVRFKRGINGGVCTDLEHSSLVVPIRRLDGINVGSYGVTKIDLIKIDVEGYEREALTGMTKTIERFKPNLFVEIHPELLPKGTTCHEIAEMVKQTYRSVHFYDASGIRWWHKIIGQYCFLSIGVRKYRDVNRLLSARREWKSSPFWMVCQS